jgi:hypothetical protein
MKKRSNLSYDDVDYATDIDMLTIMGKDKQRAALNKVNQFIKSSKNKKQVKEMIARKKQIQELIKDKSI